MSDDICEEDEFEVIDDSSDDYDELEENEAPVRDSAAIRRRLEQLQEDKALERILKGDFDDY
jgi:hypothetical protein